MWFLVFLVVATIYSTLFIGQPLAKLFSSQDVQAAIFLLGMLLVGSTIAVYAFKARSSKIEIVVLLGIVAVYLMFFLRLGLSERSHLIEYSVLAIFIHKAIDERADQGKKIPVPALWAFVLTLLIGVFDECLQMVIPHRVFDPVDILFNGMAAVMAIGSGQIVKGLRKRLSKP